VKTEESRTLRDYKSKSMFCEIKNKTPIQVVGWFRRYSL